MRSYLFHVYITTNRNKSSLYTGVTNNLPRRIIEHYLGRGKRETFTGRYHCYYLVYMEEFQFIEDAIRREKEIKGWRREKKMNLIKKTNPALTFLNEKIITDWPPKNALLRGGFR